MLHQADDYRSDGRSPSPAPWCPRSPATARADAVIGLAWFFLETTKMNTLQIYPSQKESTFQWT
ncbi:MAG: hypothetical protein IRA32_12515, partial [Xanthomonas citri pv. citri]